MTFRRPCWCAWLISWEWAEVAFCDAWANLSHIIEFFTIMIDCLWRISYLIWSETLLSLQKRTIQPHFLFGSYTKGQIISKNFLVSSNSSKKQANKFVIVVKTNSFVHLLWEFEDTKGPLEIIWPLETSRSRRLL